MSKSNFLLVDLNEPKVKKLAETITSETSRKILNHLAEKEDSEQNIAQVLGIPISTVHYHLQKLQEAGLVKVEEFHYSPKGREVNHYQLANKYIIITPQKVSGLREKLRGILPVVGIIAGIGLVIGFFNRSSQMFGAVMKTTALEDTALEAAPSVQKCITTSASSNIWLWFIIGGVSAMVVYVVIALIKEKWKRD